MAVPQAIDIHPANREQLRAWDGAEGAYWAAHADRFDRSLARYTGAFLETARIRPGERVLDIGCGTGQTTRAAARMAAGGAAVGIDLSSTMLDVARRNAERERLSSVRFVHGDVQVHPFEAGSFDVAISRTGAMFFADPVAAFGNVARALVMGGRLALLVWQPVQANEWFQEIVGAVAAGRPMPAWPPDAPGPFSWGDPGRTRAILTEAGYDDIEIWPMVEPLWFGRDPDDAVAFLSGLLGWMLDGLGDEARPQALRDLHRVAGAHVTSAGVELGSAAWVVSARRA
jgi:SAM-dependent methyltransferase